VPIATLEFDLPEEQPEFSAAIHGGTAKLVLWDIDQRCRSLVKYNDAASDDARRLAEEIRDMIPSELLED
jgi:hypothetical protein